MYMPSYAFQSFVAISLLLIKIFKGSGNLFPPCVRVLIVDDLQSIRRLLS